MPAVTLPKPWCDLHREPEPPPRIVHQWTAVGQVWMLIHKGKLVDAFRSQEAAEIAKAELT